MEDLIISGAKLEKSQSEKLDKGNLNNDFQIATIQKQNSYDEFRQYFLKTESFTNYAEKYLYGEMQHSKCRWSAWRAFLDVYQIGDEEKIRAKVKQDRDSYSKDYDKFTNFRSKQKLKVDDDNPLSTSVKVYFSCAYR